MSTSSTSEGLTGLANGIEKSLNAYGHVTLSNDDWKDVVSALRLAATPKAGVDREVIARIIDPSGFEPDNLAHEPFYIDLWKRRALATADAILALLPSVLGGVDQPRIPDGPQCNEQSGKQLSLALLTLQATRDAIAKAPEDTWGMTGDEDGYGGFRCWPIQHELLAIIDETIAQIAPPLPQTDTLPPDNAGLVSGGGR